MQWFKGWPSRDTRGARVCGGTLRVLITNYWGVIMKKNSVIATLLLAALIIVISLNHNVAANSASANVPAYTADGKLVLPSNYRDWTFLTSGFGMNYSQGVSAHPMFTNVYVTPEALQGFKSTGKWPDKSMFIVEIYSPASHGSINKGGHY